MYSFNAILDAIPGTSKAKDEESRKVNYLTSSSSARSTSSSDSWTDAESRAYSRRNLEQERLSQHLDSEEVQSTRPSAVPKRSWTPDSSEDSPQATVALNVRNQEEIKTPLRELIEASSVGIRSKYPMSEYQMQLIHRSLCDLIEDINIKASGPSFSGFIHKTDWIMIVCDNSKSERWLKRVLPTLEPWPDAELSIIETRDIPNVTTGTAYIPYSEALTVSSAFNLLSIQNRGLNTEYWRVVKTTYGEWGEIVKFTLDHISAEVLRSLNGRVTLGFKKIKIETESIVSETLKGPVAGPSRINPKRRKLDN
ncbi:uncharacterized protein LOC114249211 [Bombyx mandarina]|uniref:Uncharacterized protein LOC114249211 n=1 Tax=Bombyx mandarina TaxID=7092 RepID=A0A6J2K868_BOMMA|nr:uncharacterized protein LOC114249211 [Bombyx mandarina]